MEHYKILGVDKNATMEEITKAYEKKIKEFKTDINDEKRAKAFIKIFDKAYEDIKLERESHQTDNSVVMGIDEFNANEDLEYDLERESVEAKNYSSSAKEKKKTSSNSTSVKKKKSSKNNPVKRSSTEKSNDKNNIKDKEVAKEKREYSMIGALLQLPLKAIALALIVILSTILLLCKVISLASWLASRLIIAATIGVASIHGYQIYIGHAVRYDIFILCAAAFIIALFLPGIVRIVPSIIGGVNDKLKSYVF